MTKSNIIKKIKISLKKSKNKIKVIQFFEFFREYKKLRK